MSPSLEHDYIGLSEVPSTESSEKTSSSASTTTEKDEKKLLLKYEETELRLGLPGSDSLETEAEKIRNNKRVFSDAIDVSGKWGFEGEVSKGSALFSPKGKLLNGLENPAVKEVGSFPKPHAQENKSQISSATHHGAAPVAKAQVVGWPPIRSFRRNTSAQVVGWPPIRSFRKNTMTMNPTKNNDDAEGKTGHDCLYIKVSMDGAPYLRKVDLKTYGNYMELSSALEKMFSCFTIGQCGSHGIPCKDGLSERRLMDLLHGSEYVLTYEDKDGDWMLVGDVPWEMFINSCKRLRIMKSSEAIGLAPRAMEKCKNRY